MPIHIILELFQVTLGHFLTFSLRNLGTHIGCVSPKYSSNRGQIPKKLEVRR